MASRARCAALLSYIVVLCLGLVVSYLLLKVPRAPLPRDEIAALVASTTDVQIPWPALRIAVSAPANGLDATELQEFVRSLASSLQEAVISSGSVPPPALRGILPCLDHSGSAEESLACLASLESDGETLSNEFELLLVPTKHDSALLLSAGRRGVLCWQKGAGGAKVADAEQLAAATASKLREAWARQTQLDREAALFEVAPAYHFSFAMVGDCQQRLSWDFRKGILGPYLGRFLRRLRYLVDIEMDSQVVTCGSLGEDSSPGSSRGVIDAAALQADFLRRAGEWPGDAVTSEARWLPPLVHFVAFKPTEQMILVDAEQRQQNSFAVQGWGVVAVVNPMECQADNSTGGSLAMTSCEAQYAASAWVSNLRSWLTLPPEAPLPAGESGSNASPLLLLAEAPRLDGVTDWELLIVSRAVHAHFIRRTAETLTNLLDLVDSLPDVVVRAEIGEMAFQAASAARQASSSAAAGDLVGALFNARRGLALALAASYDDTVVAQMYFSWEFKYAVYLPIALPLVVPVVVALLRQLRRHRTARSKRKAGKDTSGLAVPPSHLEHVS